LRAPNSGRAHTDQASEIVLSPECKRSSPQEPANLGSVLSNGRQAPTTECLFAAFVAATPAFVAYITCTASGSASLA